MRELREELGVETEPLERIPGEWPLKPGYVLQVWTARLLSGEPRPLEDHDELRWLAPHETDAVDWLDQDRPAVAEAAAPARQPGEPGRGGARAGEARRRARLSCTPFVPRCAHCRARPRYLAPNIGYVLINPPK